MTIHHSLNEEQGLFIETVHRFLQENVNSDYCHGRLESPISSDEALWNKLRELGFFEYFLDSESLDYQLLSALAVESGNFLLPEPLCETLLSGPILLNHLIDRKDRKKIQNQFGDDFFEQVSSGEKRIGIAPVSEAATYRLKAKKKTVSGELFGVPAAERVAAVITTAGEKPVLFMRSDASIKDESLPLDRLLPRSALHLNKEEGITLASLDIVNWESAVRLIAVSELVGIATRVVSMTQDYVTQRKQFGKPVGSFQAVQHKLVDAYHKQQELSALLSFSIEALIAGNPQVEVMSLVSIAKASLEVPEIVEAAIQLHGGIGFTWEYDLHLYLRRAKTYQALYSLSEGEEEAIIELSTEL